MTSHEKKTIGQLRRLAKEWPDTLWLFAGDGQLHVMRTGPKGQRMETASGGVDPEYVAATIDIPCDGGGW